MTTGEKIKKRRLELGITQKDVARMIGTTNAYVSAVEKQKRGVKKETRLAKFAEALECANNRGERQWLIIQNTLNEAHLLKESRKHIAMAVRTTTALDAVLAVLAMPLKLWKMPRQH